MADGDEGVSARLKERIFDAARAELLRSGIDGFGIERVALRAGVEPGVIREHWHDRRVLLMDVMLARTDAPVWDPDTGSLYADLETVAAAAVENSRTETGRALFRRFLPGGDDVDLAETGADLWTARFRDAAQILQRAADRGQLRDGVVPEEAIRMVAAALYYDVIFTDSPVRRDYADQVVDVVLHGVLGTADRERPWPDVEARRAEVLMRVWADALIDPVVLYEAVRDERGAIVDFVCRDLNRAACAEVGLTRPELLGRTAVEMLPNFEGSGLLERYANCLDSGEPLVLNGFLYKHYDQERRLDIRATTAAADLITATWRDVTDRFEAAQRPG